MTTRLAIVAHYDPRGDAAPHFLRQLDQIRDVYGNVVVVTPSDLGEEAEARISERAQVFRRSNYGHDFGSWRDALERLDWGDGVDELLLTNDSYVGFFRPLDAIVEEMSRQEVEAWGITATGRRGWHIQSYFMHFTSPVLRSDAFRKFWMDAKPAPDRMTAILSQEVGISAALQESGFALGAYFRPTVAERLRANARGVHWLYQRQRAFPARYDSLDEDFFSARRVLDPGEADNLNTSSAYADSAFHDGRLPVVKFDVLRNDPFWLDSAALLSGLEREYPEQLAGVHDYLRAVASEYSARPYENHRYAELHPLQRVVIGYSRKRLPARRRPARATAQERAH